MYDRPQTRPLIENALRRAFPGGDEGGGRAAGSSDKVFDDLLDRLDRQETAEQPAHQS